ncbi:MAG: flavin reductase family protein [Flavobacteriales bacterium]
MNCQNLDPKSTTTKHLHGLLLGAIGPRPIALVSSMDKAGHPNLSPFSFFNIFSANPPVLIFSPARRVRDNTTKHTLENALEHPEVVVNLVNYNMVDQCSLSSTEYEKGVDEFKKSGLTPLKSEKVKPFRVKESPMQLECKVLEVKALGDQGGAGNLVICEIVHVHVHDQVLDANGLVDPFKLDIVSRMGGNWYCRANGEALFEVEKPLARKGIGFDALPKALRESEDFTGNDLAKLANVESIPDEIFIENWKKNSDICKRLSEEPNDESRKQSSITQAKLLLKAQNATEAWCVLLSTNLYQN